MIQDAIILAGGLGTRLEPLTLHTPKVLLPVFGRPFLESQLFRLSRAGVLRVRLSLGHQAQAVLNALPRIKKFGLKVSAVRESSPLGTGGAIRKAWPHPQKPCLVLNGDVLSDSDIGAFAKAHLASGAVASLWLLRRENVSRYGVLTLGQKKRILRFEEKPKRARAGLINAGLYAFQPELLEFIPRSGAFSAERELFPRLLSSGSKVQGYEDPRPPYWKDIGTLEAYVEANTDAACGRVKLEGFWR
ncbi:MAG: nucleotidyltransferase family protein [candidate division FCPU426 bacterium]